MGHAHDVLKHARGAERSRETAADMRSGYETRFNRGDVLVRHIGKRSTKRAGHQAQVQRGRNPKEG